MRVSKTSADRGLRTNALNKQISTIHVIGICESDLNCWWTQTNPIKHILEPKILRIHKFSKHKLNN
jgi:hypothetical protein